MPSTRSSARNSANASVDGNANDKASADTAAGAKRKPDGSPAREKKHQKTIEESLPGNAKGEDTSMKDEGHEESVGNNAPQKGTKSPGLSTQETKRSETEKNGDTVKDDVDEEQPSSAKNADEPEQELNKGASVVQDADREETVPSSILEKGIIYFFFRGRVGIDEPQGVQDIARSYIVLRPLPKGAKIGEGPMEDAENNRLLALPKKVLPKSSRDRFMIFVEKARTSMKDLRENFIAGSDYSTQTQGARHAPAATPMGEGVYALVDNGRETHLAYILTRPSKIDEIQRTLGLAERGSFLTSAKNPESRGPANTNLPNPANYPKEILDEFHGRGWMPLQSKLLDYENTQFILIGSDFSKVEQDAGNGQGKDKETPLEEIEKLEHEDDIRVEHLKGDDPVFEDLGLSSQEYSKLQTTW